MNSYKCKTAQSGFAVGKAFYADICSDGIYSRKDPAGEMERLRAAAAELTEKMVAWTVPAEPMEASLIEAQILILKDDDFIGAMLRCISEEGLDATEAVTKIVEQLCRPLKNNTDAYFRERCEDLRALGNGLQTMLRGTAREVPAEGIILVGRAIGPSDITMTGKEHIRGILSQKGSPLSHVAILAGNFGIPYLYGLEDITGKIGDLEELILDSERGLVIVDPPEEELRQARWHMKELEKGKRIQSETAAYEKTTVRICANISAPEEADRIPETAADGIGLFRSEFLFLDRTQEPSEEEQFEAYRYVVRAMAGRETVIRTMDIGSDKKAAWLDMPEEENPALGARGIRLSLAHRAAFRTQLRALLRAAIYGKLKIMIPMVTSLWELEETRKEIERVAQELDARKETYEIPELGVMIETPAAVMIAEKLAREAAFFSIGTNDLTQYTLAADRESVGAEGYFDPEHEAVMRMVEQTIQAAHLRGIPVSICGELAADTNAVERLLRLGADELSVSFTRLASVRTAAVRAEERIKAKGGEPGSE